MHIDRVLGISLGLTRRGYAWAFITPNGDVRSGERCYLFDRIAAGKYMRLGFSRRDAFFGMRHDQFARFVEYALDKLPDHSVSYDIPYSLSDGHVCAEYSAQIGYLQLYCYRKKRPLVGVQRLDLNARMTGIQDATKVELVNKINERGHNVTTSSEARAIGLVYFFNPNVWLSRVTRHDYTKLGFRDIDRMGNKKNR